MPSAIYSCVVDNKPLYYYQGLVFVHTLVQLAGVAPDAIVVHLIEGTPQAAIEVFRGLGVRAVVTAPFNPDRPASHKLMQLETDLVRSSDYAVLCDTDIAFAAPVSEWISGERLRAKPVDYPKPPLAHWSAIFKALALDRELLSVNATHKSEPTYANNFNGGFYIIPKRLLEDLREVWPRRYNQLLASPDLLDVLGESSIHVFQISLGAALAELGHLGDPLPLEMNFPTQVSIPEHNRPVREPRVIHYHKQLNLSGHLLTSGDQLVDQAIDRINAVIKASPAVAKVASTLAFKRTILGQQTRRRVAGLARPMAARFATHRWSAPLSAVLRRRSV